MSQNKIKTQKIIKVGNSYAVTLDKKFLDGSNLTVNDALVVEYGQDNIHIRPQTPQELSPEERKERQKQVLASRIDPEFRDWVDQTIKDDKEVLEALLNS